MQVSCKVSYSVLVYVERQGAQLEGFFEKFETPIEFLKDPSGRLEFREMEAFLEALADYLGFADKARFFREIGRNNFELRAWGVLDSVLKMVESPADIFLQPDRFLSYFLTPHPDITIQSQGDHQLLFTLNQSPPKSHVSSYLLGAVEGLPHYMGMPQAQIEALS